MPLSKAKQAEWMREYRKRRRSVIPKSSTVIPKLPWYAGASDHFGIVRNSRYAKEFLISLGLT